MFISIFLCFSAILTVYFVCQWSAGGIVASLVGDHLVVHV